MSPGSVRRPVSDTRNPARESQTLDRPFAGVGAQFDRRILNRPRAEIDDLGIDSKVGRNRHRRGGCDQATQARQHPRRRWRDRAALREKAIRIQRGA